MMTKVAVCIMLSLAAADVGITVLSWVAPEVQNEVQPLGKVSK